MYYFIANSCGVVFGAIQLSIYAYYSRFTKTEQQQEGISGENVNSFDKTTVIQRDEFAVV